MSFHLRGETGATLDATRRTLPSLKIRDAAVRYATLEPDSLSWTCRTQDVDAGQTIIPDIGQKVSLYHDEERIFHGHVTETTALLHGVRVTVEGAWWWMAREEATSEIEDDTATTDERPSVTFAEGSVATHLGTLIDTIETDFALPIKKGTISTAYTIPQVSFSLTSWAEVFARLMEWVPDAVAWFDHGAETGDCQAATATTLQLAAGASAVDDYYNGLEIEMRDGANAGETRVITDYDGTTKTATVSTWTTTPTAGDTYTIETVPALNVTRRGDATATTYTIGTDDLIEPFEFRPRIELKVENVVIPYATVSAGEVAWAKQSAGTYATGRRQIVPISGPELADFLPVISTDSYARQAGTLLNSNARIIARLADSNLLAPVAAGLPASTYTVNTFSGALNVCAFASQDYPMGTTSGGGYTTKTWTTPAGTVTALDGSSVSLTGKYLLLTDDPPDWWVDEKSATPVIVAGLASFAYPVNRYDSPYTAGDIVEVYSPAPDWVLAMLDAGWEVVDSGFVKYGIYVYQQQVFEAPFSFRGYLVPSSMGTSAATDSRTTGSFSFSAPPTGLATNLLAASNWLPWEGVITRRVAALPTPDLLGRKFSVSGTIAGASTAAALPRAATFDLDALTVGLELGAPPRADFRTLVGRTQRNSQDNLTLG